MGTLRFSPRGYVAPMEPREAQIEPPQINIYSVTITTNYKKYPTPEQQVESTQCQPGDAYNRESVMGA